MTTIFGLVATSRISASGRLWAVVVRYPAACSTSRKYVSTFVDVSTHRTVVSGGTLSPSRSRRWTSVSASASVSYGGKTFLIFVTRSTSSTFGETAHRLSETLE